MRVPDLSATAGNAAQITHIGGNASNQHFSLSVIEGIEFNKNGNWLPTNHINPSLYLPRNQIANANVYNATTSTATADAVVYSSTADEFVQKALSSAQTPFCDYNTVTSQRLEFPQRNAHSLCYGKEHSGNNTYNKTFGDKRTTRDIGDLFSADFDYVKNATQSREIEACGTVLDPFVVRSEPGKRDTNLQKTVDFRFGDNNGMRKHANHEFVSEDQLKPNADVKQRSQGNPSSSSTQQQYNDDADHEYDDQSMLDICNESYNKVIQNHNDDLDEYLTSPTSSSVSSSTPQRSYFPRGIINPNYPGFQHLAHTLSEHFVGCLPSDSYDSDMSEYEMELSADSLEELPDERQLELNMKLNIYNNNSNNNARAISPQSSLFLDANSNNNSDVANSGAHDLHDNLNTVLTLDAAADGQSAYEHTDQNEAEPCWDTALKTSAAVQKDTYGPSNSITPDILIKNHSLHVEPRLKKENRPDLLRGVSPQPIRNRTPNSDNITSVDYDAKPMPTMLAKISQKQVTGRSPRKSDLAKDEVCFGMTPVDIIGDFEQEVEREFGLLVSGYRRLMDAGVDDVNEDNISYNSNAPEKLSDAALSGANDHIDSHKFLAALNQTKDNDDTGSDAPTQNESVTNGQAAGSLMDFIEDNNAVDWSYGTCEATASEPQQLVESKTQAADSNRNLNSNAQKPKYQKSSYDERQLPPVAIEYKRCQQSSRNSRKSQNHEKTEKSTKGSSCKVSRNHMKTGFTNRFFNAKRSSGTTSSGITKGGDKSESKESRKREEAELHQYQQLISDKEFILSNSRYAKLSVWAQYLKNSVKEHNSKYSSTDLVSPSALDLFDAYKIGTDFDMETLQKHLKMAKEIEKKRRSDREEIRRRLAMGAEENNETSERLPWKPSVQSRMPSASIQFGRLMDPYSDTESHSSDSETCPKLSKTKHLDNTSVLNISLADKPTYSAYGGRSISSNSLCTNKPPPPQQQQQQQHHQQQQHFNQNMQPSHLPAISNEDRECDFFTKQARLQIEARMALAQAKEMAHMQMEIERQNQRVSPITDIIRVSLRKVGVQMTTDKRRVSRQMLTDMNIAQLQILVNSLHTHIEELNEALVHNLMERDDLHVSQDSMLVDIEELTRYIGANEHLAQQYKKPNLYNQAI